MAIRNIERVAVNPEITWETRREAADIVIKLYSLLKMLAEQKAPIK